MHPKVGAPRALLAIHGVHGRLGLFNRAEVDKQVIMVTGFKSLGRVRSEQLANVFTIVLNKIMLECCPAGLMREIGTLTPQSP